MTAAAEFTVAAPEGRVSRVRGGAFLRAILGFAIVLAAWEGSVRVIGLSAYFYPGPADVWAAFIDLLQKGILPADIVASLHRYGIGVLIGLVAGVSVGIAVGLSAFWSRLLGPIVNFLYAIVEVAWIPLLVIWWGYGDKTIVVALCYVVFFPVLYNTVTGVRTVPPVLVNAARSLGGSRWNVLREVILPSSLPNIITGFRVGAGFAFRGLIFAEMIAAKSGLGFLIFDSASTRQTARVMVGMICMGLLWLVLDRLYLRPIERATVERWGLTHSEGGES